MKQKGISVLTGGAYKLFRRPHLLRLSSLLCRFSFPHLPYCIPATHILSPFVQKVRYVNRICFSEELINTACPWNRSMYLRASALFSASCMLRPSWFIRST